MEMWRTIPGYEGIYEASDQGRIRSLDRTTTAVRRVRGVVLALMPGSNGYRQVNLHRDHVQKTHLVHRLVMLAFAGEPPTGQEVRHLNGDRSDNRAANLAWGTHLENMRDQREHGTHKNSRKTHCPAMHPYEGDNLMVEKNGNRRCAKCRREAWRRLSARRSAERSVA